MGSKPIRAVPVQAYNVREAEDGSNELVHSQSDGIVSRRQRRQPSRRTAPRRLQSLGADNHQDSYQSLINRLGFTSLRPSSSVHPAPSSPPPPSSNNISPSSSPPPNSNIHNQVRPSMARSASPTFRPSRYSPEPIHHNSPASSFNNSNNNPNLHADYQRERPHTTAGTVRRGRSSSGGATSSIPYQPGLVHYNNNFFSNNQNQSQNQSYNPNNNGNGNFDNDNSFYNPRIISNNIISSPSLSSSLSPSPSVALRRTSNLLENSNNHNALPDISRTDSLRNSYDANPQIYMFLKAQEMGFERERIREVMDNYQPTSLNDLLRRLINYSSSAVANQQAEPVPSSAALTHYAYEQQDSDRMIEQDTIPSSDNQERPSFPPIAIPNKPPSPSSSSSSLSSTPSTPTSSMSMDGYCVICLDKKAECAVIPCGHLCTCLKCGKRLHDCPICRSNMTGILKIYRV